MTRLGLRLMRRWMLVIAALALVAGDWRTLVSPGRLSGGHAGLSGDCDQCHLVFDGVPAEKCLDCHAPLATLIKSGDGYHASIATQACTDCHGDHHGASGSLTEADALAAFDHDKARFHLGGAHAKVACADCHTAPVGELSGVCIDCHTNDDPHESGLGPACGTCHVATRWDAELKTLAAHVTSMDGGHAGLGCTECHRLGEHLDDDVPCADCHPEAHGGTTSPCEDCHTVAAWKPAGFDHGPCTCTFAGAHQTAACLDCHADFVFTNTPTLCSGCHTKDRPHEPLGECSRCHEATSFAENRFDHDTSKFPLRGQHLEVDCAGCHAMDGVFRGRPTACEGCHADAGEAAHGDFGPCATCHVVDHAGFTGSTFDHATTGFALTGRHAGLSCRGCHPDKVDALRRAP